MLIWFIAGNLINKASITDSRLEPISVIIAIRNGEKSLPKLIHNLQNSSNFLPLPQENKGSFRYYQKG